MPDQLIYVDAKPFLGRVEEQKQFRAALRETLDPPPGEDLPYICLLYGDGGIGKTTLAKRFRDIAQTEVPFEGEFEMLWVDWEDARGRVPGLQGGHQYVSPETVFDVLYNAALRQGWEKHFRGYGRAVKACGEAEKKAAEALAAGDPQDELAALRGVGAEAIAKIVRLGVPGIGNTGEKLTQAFLDAGIKVGAEQAAQLRAALETRLRARLSGEQFDLYTNPRERLAHALAAGLHKAAGRLPLLLVLDTYEIADRADPWLRLVIRAAGTGLLWVFSGRNDLVRSRTFGQSYFKGYAEDFPRRLLAYDMRQLALDDVQAYFAERVPGRPLDEASAAAISQATRGIPLAIQQAADMWKDEIPLVDIVGDTNAATPQKEIVSRMTARYMLHVVQGSPDETAIYALALASGDLDILRAMLPPDGESHFDLEAELRRLARLYASIHAGEARLHDEPALFFRQYLRADIRRTSETVQALNRRAAEALRERVAKLEAELPLIEERCEDEDWVAAALDLARYLFWLDETGGWQWLAPRFVEGLAYSRELRRGLLEGAGAWKDTFSKRGKKRLKLLRAGTEVSELVFTLPFSTSFGSADAAEAEGEMLDELTRLERLGWLAGEGETERGAILSLHRGRLHYRREEYREALARYERAERGLPEEGEALRKQLGDALYDLAGKLIWPEGRTDAVYSPEVERILPKVVAWLPEKQGAWYRLGATLDRAGKKVEAIAAYQKAIELDPNYASPHNGLGNVYVALGRPEEAIAAYQKAIELDPKLAVPHNGLGNVYRALRRP
ncbi:MAG: tetratricopeptide repeat protein, partial [Chloroflexota bacterium]